MVLFFYLIVQSNTPVPVRSPKCLLYEFTSVRIQISPWKNLNDFFDLDLKVTKFTGLILLEMICVCSLIFFNDESNTNVNQCQVSWGITDPGISWDLGVSAAHLLYLLRGILIVTYRHIVMFKGFRKRYLDFIKYLLKRIII